MVVEWIAKKGGWKNTNHLIWFICTMYFAILTLLLLLNKFGRYLLLGAIVLHLFPIINVIWFAFVKKEKSEVYSLACIPYNAAMIVFYVILMVKIKF